MSAHGVELRDGVELGEVVIRLRDRGPEPKYQALVQRRYTETAGALAVSVLFVLVALFFVYQPERTVGEASRWTNQLSLAFLSGANRGSLDDPGQAKRQVADHLFGTLVYQPWVVLEFGGLSHCVDTRHPDQDGFPTPVGPHDPAANVYRDHMKAGTDEHGGYAPRFLRQPAGSKERTAPEYDALRTGSAPADSQFRGYRVDKTDSPAAGGAFQRLTFSVVVFLGALGADRAARFLSLAVILAQVVALVLLGFAPVALIIGIFPGAGHEFFRGWLAKLATAVFIKALYSLVITIVVAVSAALTGATGSLGFLFAFGLQTLSFWAIFVYRKQITARLVAATTGSAAPSAQMPRMTVVQRGAHVATRPFGALVGVTRRGVTGGGSWQQDSALSGATETARQSADGATGTTAPDARGHRNGKAHPPVVSANGTGPAPPANGNGRPPQLSSGDPLDAGPAAPGNGASAPAARRDLATASANPGEPPTPDATPSASHEDVMRRARELRERPTRGGPDGRGAPWLTSCACS